MPREKMHEPVGHEDARTVFFPQYGQVRGPIAVVRSTEALHHRITRVMRQLSEAGGSHNFVILELPAEDNIYYVQFLTSCGSAVVYGEAVSDHYLTRPLSREQRATLQHLGWRPPTRRKYPNYFRCWTVLNDRDRRIVAQIALNTLDHVYGWQRSSPLKITTHLDW